MVGRLMEPGRSPDGSTLSRKALRVASDNDLAVNWAELDGGALRGRAYLRMGASGPRGREKLWQQHDVVSALYAIARGREGQVVDVDDLLSATGMAEGQVYNALDRLEQDGAIRSFNGHCVMLLQKGIEAFERAATKPYRMMSAGSPPASARPGLAATAPAIDRAPRS